MVRWQCGTAASTEASTQRVRTGVTMWDEQFETLLRKQLSFLPPDEPITGDTQLRDYGLDSLGMVELLAGLEAAYDVHFRDEALSLEIFETPQLLWDALQGLR